MGEIVMGIGASHTTLMNTQWDKVDHLGRAHNFRNALQTASDALHSTDPNTVIVVGSNHFRGYWLDMMPALSMGIERLDCAGEHGTPTGSQTVDRESALTLCEYLIESGFDLAFSTRLSVDHGISHAIQYLVGENRLPVIPLVVNCFAPPLPGLARCLDFGASLGEAVSRLPGKRRYAIIATGGLSHSLPFPDWRQPCTDDDEFLVDSWKRGRGRWSEFERRRREIVVNHPPRINEDFDRAFLEMVRGGKLQRFAEELSDRKLPEIAGNGGNEVRAWLIMAAALGHRPGKTLCYSPMPEWLTGMAVSIIEP